MAGWNHANAKWKPKTCGVCGTTFTPKSGVHKFCSAPCKGKWKYITGIASTENQYLKISGNWKRYCSRLLYYGGRKRDHLTAQMLLDKLEAQNYRCALSNVELTCELLNGVLARTNASVDRIVAGGPYTSDNIQMVCKAVNMWRGDLPVDEFVEWCRKVAAHHDPRTLFDAQGEKENDHGETA